MMDYLSLYESERQKVLELEAKVRELESKIELNNSKLKVVIEKAKNVFWLRFFYLWLREHVPVKNVPLNIPCLGRLIFEVKSPLFCDVRFLNIFWQGCNVLCNGFHLYPRLSKSGFQLPLGHADL